MRYVSTRGGAEPVGFADAMINGLAPDGGLYVPSEMPAVSADEFREWAALSYAELATEIMFRFAPDMGREVIAEACHGAYTAANFGSDEIAPMTQLADGTWLLHLSNGPTLAFKDMAMQLLGRLLDAELARRDQTMTVLAATSGDTGASAEHAMVGRERISVVMLAPHRRVSPFQAAQMYSLDEPNISNLAVQGVFDDCQDLVKEVNADAAFKSAHAIGAVNSINWARVAAQVVYYVWAYLRLQPDLEAVVEFSVPTGNFGNIYAGLVARRLGLPIGFVLATNENNVLDEARRTGVYRVRSSDEVVATSSPSMDIAKASNFERFVFDMWRGDSEGLRATWGQLEADGQVDLDGLSTFRHSDEYLRTWSSTHANRIETIRAVAVSDGYVVDPHTADGIYAGRREQTDMAERLARPLMNQHGKVLFPGIPTREQNPPQLVCLETALPAKFEATIVEALGQRPPRPARFVGLEDRPQQVTVIPAEVEAVKAAIETMSAGSH